MCDPTKSHSFEWQHNVALLVALLLRGCQSLLRCYSATIAAGLSSHKSNVIERDKGVSLYFAKRPASYKTSGARAGQVPGSAPVLARGSYKLAGRDALAPSRSTPLRAAASGANLPLSATVVAGGVTKPLLLGFRRLGGPCPGCNRRHSIERGKKQTAAVTER